jgi:diguanylate cyclase (GGDEF)-like protein
MSKIKMLFIEDNSDYANLLTSYFKQQTEPVFDIAWADTLGKALSILAKDHSFDIILTDLFLPDSSGIDTFMAIQQDYSHIPVVVATAYDDESVAVKAVQNGAQDYLIKGDITGKMIARVLIYALQRHKMREELKSLSLTDELTRLGNRRSFLTLAEQHIKLSQRRHNGFLLIMADLDGLKRINDTFGHAAGDEALRAVAYVLQATFRQSDIIARIGGDEFAVLAIDAQIEKSGDILNRLDERLEQMNNQKKFQFPITLSTGIIYADPQQPMELRALMEKADKALYQQKCAKSSQR